MSMTFRHVSYRPCSCTGVTCVSSDFGGIIWLIKKKKLRKITRWENHKRFNVRCSQYIITLTSISMTTNVTGIRAQHIIKKAELQLLGVRIQQCTYTIKNLSESLTMDKQQLEAILNSDEMVETERMLTAAQRQTFEETRSRQQSKFERLYNKSQTKNDVTDNDIDTNRWVMNLSGRQISDDERSLLIKGLLHYSDYAPGRRNHSRYWGSCEIHVRGRRTQRGSCTYHQTS